MSATRTSVEGGGCKMSKTYRYTISAHQEIDVCASNRADADKKAESIWHSYFGNKSLFGDIEFIKEVKDE